MICRCNIINVTLHRKTVTITISFIPLFFSFFFFKLSACLEASLYLRRGWKITVMFLAPGLQTNFISPPSIRLSSAPPGTENAQGSGLSTVTVCTSEAFLTVHRQAPASVILKNFARHFGKYLRVSLEKPLGPNNNKLPNTINVTNVYFWS